MGGKILEYEAKTILREGISQGLERGQNLLAELMEYLFADNRVEEAKLAAKDKSARNRFYKEYGIILK